MMARLTGLQDAWRGSAATRFQGVATEWRGTQARVRESLDQISRLLAQAGQQYAAAEQQNTSMFADTAAEIGPARQRPRSPGEGDRGR